MRTPRMTKTATLALALLCLVALISPQQLPVVAYKVGLVLIAGVAGYILDRALFPYARPDRFIARPIPLIPPNETETEKAVRQFNTLCEVERGDSAIDPWLFFMAQARRAVIVAAAMLAVGLGL
ncbi:MAG: putative holin [Pseudodesulfovibrio sp.]|uniref:putative holin n=1 Tax=Pseudodesulfovibrio sp. TaxID=2035812 RepID=UPI003D097CBD